VGAKIEQFFGWGQDEMVRDLLGRDQDESRDLQVRDRDVEHFVQDKLVHLETVSRLRRRDRDHIPDYIIIQSEPPLDGLPQLQ